jgi:short subunit dehydrogenase-like uncharacterized protein
MAAPTIGIVGAYGETGAVVARTLAAQHNAQLRLIGRNADKLRQLAGTLSGDITEVTADVMDHDSLSAACRGCHTIVACAAPASTISDRVARAALESACHFVDPGADPSVKAYLESQDAAIKSKGLVCVLGAGYVPGLSEMMMQTVYEIHRGTTTDPVTLELIVVDRNEWSLNGFIDLIDHFCRHPPEIGVYRGGRWVTRSMLTAWKRRRMPHQSTSETLMPVRWPEIEPFLAEAKPPMAAAYIPLDPWIYLVGRFFAIFAPNRLDLAAHAAKVLLRFKVKRQGGGGILYAEATGRKGRAPEQWLVEVPAGRHYERTGEVAALASALIVDGTLKEPGVQYLAAAVDPHDFIVRLRVWGVEVIELNAKDFEDRGPNAR